MLPFHVQQAVPFFGVTNIETSARWYVDRLGFAMTKTWTPEGKLRWCWLQLGDAALMLQEFAKVPDGPLGTGVSINFICDDAIAFHREVKSRGATALQTRGPSPRLRGEGGAAGAG